MQILTDNRNRTAGEIRKIFELSGGKLGSTGCVAWMFDTKGFFLIPAAKVDEDKLMEIALESGADDVKRSGDNFEVTCNPTFSSRSPRPSMRTKFPRKRGNHSHPKDTVALDAETAPRCSGLWRTSTITTTSRTSPPISISRKRC